ncbi:hypothetical protein GF359_07270 [candidate division WOR-3 bacterium]|uniref:Tetratricopeptide repeat protein n=1 Tax=candidate division WOR-3 bacterium TaxID=2052148 RepID=A0A9D5KAB3_UNCW3|nr:hypothetical protein [candidate division WOR-3 bacterium]MBD3365000.1 hypothetical protein [candidate division WOR-3 bacterium]
MIYLLITTLFSQTPIDFADHLYATGDFQRAALEYERIGFMLETDTPLASYALLRAGESLLRQGERERASQIYSAGLGKFKDDEHRYTYGLIRSSFPEGKYIQVDTLAANLEGTELNRQGTVYRSFALAFAGDTAGAVQHFASLQETLPGNAALRLIRTPPRHRSPFFIATLSTVLPGAGQAYCGRWGDAWQSFSVTALMTGAGVYYLAFSQDSTSANTVKGIVFTSLGGLFWLGNIYGAVNAALDYNEYEERKRTEQLYNLMKQFDLDVEIKRP